MDANTITVYRGRQSLRVVRGEHAKHIGSESDRITVYPDAVIALAHERADDVRAAILRIEPDSDRVRVKVGKIKKALPAQKFAVGDSVTFFSSKGYTPPDGLPGTIYAVGTHASGFGVNIAPEHDGTPDGSSYWAQESELVKS
jgi:hypothetical protein